MFNAPADRAALAPYREAGIQRVLLEVPDLSRDEILRVLDRNAPLARLQEAEVEPIRVLSRAAEGVLLPDIAIASLLS